MGPPFESDPPATAGGTDIDFAVKRRPKFSFPLPLLTLQRYPLPCKSGFSPLLSPTSRKQYRYLSASNRGLGARVRFTWSLL